MKSMRTYGIAASTLALLLVGLTSARASTIDINTHGNWLTGGPGGTQVYGGLGYILNDYGATTPGNLTSGSFVVQDVTGTPPPSGLPSFLISYTYAGLSGNPQENAISLSAGNPTLEDPQAANPATDPRVNAIVWDQGVVTVHLNLAANHPRFQLATYVYSTMGQFVDYQDVSLDTSPVQVVRLTLGQINAGTWVVFDVPAGPTALNLGFGSPGWGVGVNGIMFDEIVPEPSSIALLGIGAALLWFRRRQQR